MEGEDNGKNQKKRGCRPAASFIIRVIKLLRSFYCLILSCALIGCIVSCQPFVQSTLLETNLTSIDIQNTFEIPIKTELQILPTPTPIPILTPTSNPTIQPTIKPTNTPKPTPIPKPTLTPITTLAPSSIPTSTLIKIQIHLPGIPNNWPITTNQQNQTDQFITLVNKVRVEAGLNQLTKGNEKLQEVSSIRSAEISILFSHSRPTEDINSIHWYDLLKAFKINYSLAGENLTGGPATPELALTTFMNSEGHRNNILNPKFTTIAISIYTDINGKNWWVQEFIG